MAKGKQLRFADCHQVLACPICKEKLNLNGSSLMCPNRHCFDIAKQGYVNLLAGSKQSDHYSKETFESRSDILEAGYYSHILDAVQETIASFSNAEMVLDVGCGEGFYSRMLSDRIGKSYVAFDISKDAVLLAARTDAGKSIQWLVGDLANIPVQDGSIDCILDVFSPSNYAEFARVLASGGRVVKVIPGKNHLIQLRQLAKDHLRNKEFSNQKVIDRFAEFFQIESRKSVSKTFEMPSQDIQSFASMTPLLFGVDMKDIDLSQIGELTIEVEILISVPSC